MTYFPLTTNTNALKRYWTINWFRSWNRIVVPLSFTIDHPKHSLLTINVILVPKKDN